MSSEYLIGKDVQDLHRRVEAIERKLGSQCKCKVIDEVAFTEEKEVTIKGQKLMAKTFYWGRHDTGDCEWRSHTVTIHSDGTYTDIAELHDHGSVFGDTFDTELRAKNEDGSIYAYWDWSHSLAAGEDYTHDGRGFEAGIRDNYARINRMGRTRWCR